MATLSCAVTLSSTSMPQSRQAVALYARVSTKDGRQDTENQLTALREYCAKQGWEIAEEYVDQETGGTSKRPRFQPMFADARARKFDLVLFWSLDRPSREGVSATLAHLERLESRASGDLGAAHDHFGIWVFFTSSTMLFDVLTAVASRLSSNRSIGMPAEL
jgi:DNA invertase Pin-like site-specific DNA recombinase